MKYNMYQELVDRINYLLSLYDSIPLNILQQLCDKKISGSHYKDWLKIYLERTKK